MALPGVDGLRRVGHIGEEEEEWSCEELKLELRRNIGGRRSSGVIAELGGCDRFGLSVDEDGRECGSESSRDGSDESILSYYKFILNLCLLGARMVGAWLDLAYAS